MSYTVSILEGVLGEYLRRKYGLTKMLQLWRNTVTVSSTSATLLLPPDGDRFIVMIMNPSTYDGRVEFSPAVTSTGIILPSGYYLCFDAENSALFPALPFYGFSFSGDAQWLVLAVTTDVEGKGYV